MYFLKQIRAQFLLTLTLWVGWPENAAEVTPQQESETPQAEVSPWEALIHARETTWAVDAQVATEEARWLTTPSAPLTFWSSVEWEAPSTDWYDLSGVELSQWAPAPLWNGPRDEYDMWERVSSPEEVALLGRLEQWEIWMDDPAVVELIEELGMEEFMRTAWIDGLERWEIDEWIEESTPEMLEWSRTEVQGELDAINSQIVSLPEWSQERQNLERRAGLLWGFIDAIESALNWEQPWIWAEWGAFGWVDVVWDRNVIARAMSHRWIDENRMVRNAQTWRMESQAEKFLMGIMRNARETPWCAGFVSYVLKEAGYNINPTLSSKAFIWETGKWHVAFYAGNGQMLGWNQSDSVSVAPIRKEIQWWTMPEDLEAGRPPNRWGTPPVWAIIVFNRGWSDRNMA